MEDALALKRRRSSVKRLWQQNKYLWLMFLPCLMYYLIFRYAPMFGLVITFKNYNLFRGVWASEWVGFKYYRMFLENPDFLLLMKNTFLLGIMNLAFGFPAPIILALLLNEVRKAAFKRFVQTVSYLPHFISNVIVASMVIMFLSPTGGLINEMIAALGFEPINFMNEPGMFRAIYVLSEIWQHIGWETIIYLAALTSIDSQLYEAASIDGAGRMRKLWHVTLPGISFAVVITLILNIGAVLEIGFEKVFLLQNPAIYETADIISTYVYRVGMEQGNFSYGAAIDLFMGVISLVFIYTANFVSRRISETSLW
ncbi:ABC transporter permease subunit [Paenibacillus sp. J5C_2022]|uniref:ABC transporter permease n=1 Tax=Paenibacillus sp. J5C2022 TaxID=2977129 RepID=UPI0021D1EACE|nr:ABC transporter permease subunit [Paenibacillus sp. J5C2022]MCU6712228.1 ABC transporter permease subunit [Paenibacillus sp. J5C2022]